MGEREEGKERAKDSREEQEEEAGEGRRERGCEAKGSFSVVVVVFGKMGLQSKSGKHSKLDRGWKWLVAQVVKINRCNC